MNKVILFGKLDERSTQFLGGIGKVKRSDSASYPVSSLDEKVGYTIIWEYHRGTNSCDACSDNDGIILLMYLRVKYTYKEQCNNKKRSVFHVIFMK